MTHYDSLADYYDEIMGDRSDVVAVVRRTLKTHAPKATTVLEVACGTGSIIAGLSDYYLVAGLDASHRMLNVARHKMPSAYLVQADMRRFDMQSTYDSVLCLFDSINHLPTIEDWRTTFACVANHLNPEGIFVLDMITQGRIQSLMRMPTYHQQTSSVVADLTINPIGPNCIEWTNTIQVEAADGVIEVHQDHAVETSFPLAAVLSALAERFDVVDQFTVTSEPIDDNAGRIYFVCRLRQS